MPKRLGMERTVCRGVFLRSLRSRACSLPGAAAGATLSDQASAFSEALTVTPSVLFGNPGGSLTAGTVHFVRPSTCAAYAPAIGATAFTVAESGSFTEKIEITNPSLYALDARLMLNFILQTAGNSNLSGGQLGVLTYQNPGPYAFSGVVHWQSSGNANGASSQFAKDDVFANSDYQNSGLYLEWNPPAGPNAIQTSLTLALSNPSGSLCNDTAAVPTSLAPVNMSI